MSPAPNFRSSRERTIASFFGASLPHDFMHSEPSGVDLKRSRSAAVASCTGRQGELLADSGPCLLGRAKAAGLEFLGHGVQDADAEAR